jgi:hypothetical protein
MGREVRMVPENWEHPKDEYGWDRPLLESSDRVPYEQWLEDVRQWNAGFMRDWVNGGYLPKDETLKDIPLDEWAGYTPDQSMNTMPNWPEEIRTHYMMYETVTEGTPLSPAFSTREELAQWLTEHEVPVFGKTPGSFEEWLDMCPENPLPQWRSDPQPHGDGRVSRSAEVASGASRPEPKECPICQEAWHCIFIMNQTGKKGEVALYECPDTRAQFYLPLRGKPGTGAPKPE